MIIGLSGKQRTGKDTLAILLQAALRNKGYEFSRKSLAEPLKIAYAHSAGMTLADLEVNKAEHRAGLQQMGEDARRHNPDFWIDRLGASMGQYENIIIPDIRYKNEYDWVRSRGGLVIRVETDRHLRQQRGTLTNEFHVSEVNLDTIKAAAWDKIFYNNQGTVELQASAVKFVEQLAPRLCEFILG